MSEDLRGLFVLEPPPGGLARLRLGLEQERQVTRGLEFMPWAATVCLLLMCAMPLLLGQVRASRVDTAATERIVQSVRGQEPQTWTLVSGSQADIPIHLARPTFVGRVAD